MESHWWTRARVRIVQRAIDRFPRLPILDIGCGPGLTVSSAIFTGSVTTAPGCEIGQPIVCEHVRDGSVNGHRCYES